MRSEAKAVHFEAQVERVADVAYRVLAWTDEAAFQAEVDDFASDVPVVNAEVDGAVAGMTLRLAGVVWDFVWTVHRASIGPGREEL
jgi:hypothetical protein